MASLIGETVDYAIEFDTETSDINSNPTGFPTPILASGSFVVGNSQEISVPITYTYTGGGFSQTFSGTATIDLNADTLTVGFSGTAQAFDLKFTLSNLAQGSVQAVTGVTQTASSGVQSGVNSELAPTVTSGSVTTGFDFFGYQPGTTISQSDQLTFNAPDISSATYDAAAGQLVVSGTNFTTSPGDFNPAGLTLTGEDGSTHTLSNASVISGTPSSTSFTVTLDAADQLAVDGLLNNNGTTSTGDDIFASGATTYMISADASFDTGAAASNGGVTVSNAQTPTIASVFYDKNTGILTLNGAGFENDGDYGGINLGQITLKGGNDQTFTFDPADYASVNSATQAVIDLSNTTSGLNSQLVMSGEEASVTALFDQDGTSSQEGTTYNFSATSGWDSGAGAAIVVQSAVVNCYLSGTRILTATGDLSIDDLGVGDTVVTASGEHRPIRWIGHRTIDCTRHPKPRSVWPVRVAAHAFGDKRPCRDLWISPGHNVFVDGVLMPVRVLINGATVVQEPVSSVTYWHVELDAHDIILAEGLPAESYLDTGNRSAFENGGAAIDLHPDFEPRWQAVPCAPIHKVGATVEAVRARLLALVESLGHATTTEHDLHIVANGRRIEPLALPGLCFAFLLPADCSTVALASRIFVPSHMDPRSSDSRELGVCVKRLDIDGRTVDLRDELSATSWHQAEAKPGHVQRWTKAGVTLPPATRMVLVTLTENRRYRIERQGEAISRAA